MRGKDAGIAPGERRRRELKDISNLVVQDLDRILKAMNKQQITYHLEGGRRR